MYKMTLIRYVAIKRMASKQLLGCTVISQRENLKNLFSHFLACHKNHVYLWMCPPASHLWKLRKNTSEN